jgi:uncharacterized protein
VIAYFDTSSIVPLLIEEPGSETAGRLWDEADRLVSIRLVYTEGHAALAQASRGRRLDPRHLRRAVTELLDLYEQLDLVEITDALVRRAGSLAEIYALRGYDALHLAAVEFVRDNELVFVSGDANLSQAADDLGLHVART